MRRRVRVFVCIENNYCKFVRKQLVAQEVKFSVWNIIIPRLTKCEPLVRNAECPRAQWWISEAHCCHIIRQIRSWVLVKFRSRTAKAWREFPDQTSSKPTKTGKSIHNIFAGTRRTSRRCFSLASLESPDISPKRREIHHPIITGQSNKNHAKVGLTYKAYYF